MSPDGPFHATTAQTVHPQVATKRVNIAKQFCRQERLENPRRCLCVKTEQQSAVAGFSLT